MTFIGTVMEQVRTRTVDEVERTAREMYALDRATLSKVMFVIEKVRAG